MYGLHQDFWFWRSETLVLGVLPVGLFYHAAYTAATSVLMWLLVGLIWPSHLDTEGRSAE